MKKIKFGSVIIVMLCIVGVSQLNAQVERFILELPATQYVECANNGLGEVVEGVLEINLVLFPNGSFRGNPMGGILIGSETGLEYHAVGAEIGISSKGGSQAYVLRYHFVAKGTHFYSKVNYHAIMQDGELKVTSYKWEDICK